MSEQTAPERIAVVWSPEARADLRAIVSKRVGGVKKLKPPRTGFRQVSHAGPLRVRVLKRVPVTSDNDKAPEAAYNAASR